MSHFIYRPKSAPHPVASLKQSEWTRYPRTEATGVIRLGAFITQPEVPAAALMTSLQSEKEQSAVLRFGYRDKAKIWLNGDIIFDGGQSHDYWLDQHAVPCHLRAGRNRLVIELTDASEQWAFVGRMTDHIGRPIAVTDEFPVETAVPEAIDGALIDGLISPWSVLSAATMSTPPQVDALIDMAWYAAKSGMPGRERTLEEVALEGAYAERTDAQTLHAWTLLLDGGRAARQRASHVPIASENQGAAGLMLRLDTAWEHFFARRLEQAWSDGRALYREHPKLSPVQRLWALLHEDLGFVDTARRLSETHLADAAQPSLGHRQTYLGALQVSGALTKEISVLQQHFDDGHATEAMRLRLAEIHRRQGHHERADTIIENMVELRPELWPMQLVGVDALRERGQVRKALGRLETIVGLAPHHTAWVERYVGLLVDTGQRAKAEQLVSLNRERLTEEASVRLSRLVDFTQRAPSLGPSRKTLTPIECGSHDAIVRYHHARLRLASAGKATRWVRRVIKICTDIGAEGFSKIRLTHIPDSQTLAVLKASRIRDNQQLTGRMTSKALSDPVNRLYYDLQETTVHFDDLSKGMSSRWSGAFAIHSPTQPCQATMERSPIYKSPYPVTTPCSTSRAKESDHCIRGSRVRASRSQ